MYGWLDNGDNRIEEFSPTGAFLSEFESEGVKALALDGHGDVFAIVDNSADECGAIKPPCEHLVEYSESGTQLADVGAGDFGSPNDELGLGARIKESMVAVDDANGRVYVSDGLKNVVWIAEQSLAPVIGQESAAEVGTSEAKLGVLVNPGGIQTTYRFEYDTREYKEGEGPHGVSVPFPEGSAGEGSTRAWCGRRLRALRRARRTIIVRSSPMGLARSWVPIRRLQPRPLRRSRVLTNSSWPVSRRVCLNVVSYELVTPPSKSSAQPDARTEKTTNNQEDNEYAGGGFSGNSRPAMAIGLPTHRLRLCRVRSRPVWNSSLRAARTGGAPKMRSRYDRIPAIAAHFPSHHRLKS